MPDDPKKKKKKPRPELPWLHEYIPDATPTRRLGPSYQSKRPVRQGLPDVTPTSVAGHVWNGATMADNVMRALGRTVRDHPGRTLLENAPIVDIPTNGVEGGKLAAEGHPVAGISQAMLSAVLGGAGARSVVKGVGRLLTHEGLTAFEHAAPEAFHAALTQFAKERPSEAGYITWRTPEEMRNEGMKTFLSSDGKTGYAIHPESGDIRNVFNFGEKGAGAHAVADAIANRGGKVLDAFDSNLGDFYRDMGFKEKNRLKWDDQYAPSNWDFAKHGRPDVVFMEHPQAGTGVTPGELLDNYDVSRMLRKAASGRLGVQAEATTTEAQRNRDALFHATQPMGQRGPMPEPAPIAPREPSPLKIVGDSLAGRGAGETIRGYHGTNKQFDQLRPGSAPGWGEGIYFTDNRAHAASEYASGPGGRVIDADVTLNNPYRGETIGEDVLGKTKAWQEVAHKWNDPAHAWEEDPKFVGKALRELGYDGVIADGSNNVDGKEIVAFHPHQVNQRGSALPDSVISRAVRGALPPQTDLPRFVGPRIAPERLNDIEQETLKTYLGPQFEEWTKNGNFANWYDTQGTQQKAIDALGDEEGPQAFKRLMQMMGATTARSDPANNLRRAQYYRALELAGLLDPDALRAGAYKAVPEGMGHLANNAHHAGIVNLLEQGAIDPLQNPKPAGFVENLMRNFRPYTNDTRMTTGAALANPKLIDLGAIVKSVGKDGATTFSPRNWAYAPMERAAQQAAEHYAGRGLLDIPAGASPTAFWQAKVWDGLAPVLEGSSPSQGIFDDVFNAKLNANAQKWGVRPSEANQMVWQGQPLDLPLNQDVIPKGLLSRF